MFPYRYIRCEECCSFAVTFDTSQEGSTWQQDLGNQSVSCPWQFFDMFFLRPSTPESHKLQDKLQNFIWTQQMPQEFGQVKRAVFPCMCCRRKKPGTQAVAKDPSWSDWNPEIPNHGGLVIEFLKKYFEIFLFLKIWLLNSSGSLHLQVWLSRRRCSRYRGFSLAQPVIKPAAVEVAEMAMEFWDYGMVQPPAQIRLKACSIIHISTIYHETWSITIYILEPIIFHCGVVQFSCVCYPQPFPINLPPRSTRDNGNLELQT